MKNTSDQKNFVNFLRFAFEKEFEGSLLAALHQLDNTIQLMIKTRNENSELGTMDEHLFQTIQELFDFRNMLKEENNQFHSTFRNDPFLINRTLLNSIYLLALVNTSKQLSESREQIYQLKRMFDLVALLYQAQKNQWYEKLA